MSLTIHKINNETDLYTKFHRNDKTLFEKLDLTDI